MCDKKTEVCSLFDVKIYDDVLYGGRDAAGAKYSLWLLLEQWARYHTNTRNTSHPRHSDGPTPTNQCALA